MEVSLIGTAQWRPLIRYNYGGVVDWYGAVEAINKV